MFFHLSKRRPAEFLRRVLPSRLAGILAAALGVYDIPDFQRHLKMPSRRPRASGIIAGTRGSASREFSERFTTAHGNTVGAEVIAVTA